MIRTFTRNRILLVTVLLVAAIGTTACPWVSRAPKHILLVTVDGLRPDRLGVQRDGRPLTPNIDSLASESTRFLRASTHAVLTLPAAASLLTGTLPPTHGIQGETGFRLRPQVSTVVERLAGSGYRGGAVLGSSQMEAISGLNHAFWTFLLPPLTQAPPESRPGTEIRATAGEINLVAMNWLRTNLQYRTFLWVHYRDLHYPYLRPGPTGESVPVEYEEALAYLDREIGAMIEAYRRLQILEDTLVILTATHGESLGEHGESTHSNFLHGATLRVPLLIRTGESLRERIPPAAVDELVGLIDVVPTILDLTGLAADDSLPGRSLAPLARGERRDDAAEVFADAHGPLLRFGWQPLRSLESGEWRLIRVGTEAHLYRISEDSGELSEISETEPDVVRTLSDRMATLPGAEDPVWMAGTEISRQDRVDLLAALNRASRAYGQGGLDEAAVITGDVLKRDPGNLFAARLLARVHRRRGDDAGAEKILKEATGHHPVLSEAHVLMGAFYSGARRPLDAVTEYLNAYELDPDRTPMLVLAAQAETQAGRQEEAVYWMDRLLERESDSAYLHALAADFFWEFLDFDKARAHLQTAWDLNLREIPDPLRLGECLQQLARYEEALDAFRAVEKAFPGRVPVQTVAEKIGDTYLLLEQDSKAILEFGRVLPPGDPFQKEIGLANLLSSKGRPDLALQVLDRLERQIPGTPEVFYVRGEIHLTEKDLEAAEADFRRVLEIDPDSGPALYNLARVALLRGDEEAALESLRGAIQVDDGSLRRILRQDPFLWQASEGSPLALYLQELVGSEPGK